MEHRTIQLAPIGRIHSRFREQQGTPRQSVGAFQERGRVEVFGEFLSGLRDLDGFSHVILVSFLDRVRKSQLTVMPPWTEQARGVFATCSYERPNAVGISLVKLERMVENGFEFSGVDLLDETPVLDIKPYIRELYVVDDVTHGWMRGHEFDMIQTRSGDRLPKREGNSSFPEQIEWCGSCLLFSYGTLQQEDVQRATFGRLLSGSEDWLCGFAQSLVEIRDPEVIEKSGKSYHPIVTYTGVESDRVRGTVFEVTSQELENADRYEVDDYQRIAVTLLSGKRAWIYVDARMGKMPLP